MGDTKFMGANLPVGLWGVRPSWCSGRDVGGAEGGNESPTGQVMDA